MGRHLVFKCNFVFVFCIYFFINFNIIWLNSLTSGSVFVPILTLLSGSGIGHNVTAPHKYSMYISKNYCSCHQLHLFSYRTLPAHFFSATVEHGLMLPDINDFNETHSELYTF